MEEKKEVTFAEKRKQHKSDEDRKKRRRRWMFAAALAGLVSFFVLRRYGYLQNIRLGGSLPFAISPMLLRFWSSETQPTKAASA